MQRANMNFFSRVNRAMISFFVGGVVVTLAADAISLKLGKVPVVFNDIFLCTVGLFLTWIAYVVARIVFTVVTQGRYAVEAFILDSENRLLVYHHPHHKMDIPPGGRANLFELPHNALVRHLEERVGLAREQYEYVRQFHHGLEDNKADLGRVERVPAPFLVQRELRRQRGFIRFHYDFVYVLRLKESAIPIATARYAPVHFVTFIEIERMVASNRSFPDIQNAYGKILRRLMGSTNSCD
jgi:ADP-ribose pyrophosphatase YjhB (NUDIX family)